MTITSQALGGDTITGHLVELSWRDAYLHELRGPDGRWVRDNDALLKGATGRKAGAVRVHDHVLYGKSVPGAGGTDSVLRPMEVTSVRHHWEGTGKGKKRFTDLVLRDPDTGAEKEQSVKDGASVKLFPREAVQQPRQAEKGGRAPAALPSAPKASPPPRSAAAPAPARPPVVRPPAKPAPAVRQSVPSPPRASAKPAAPPSGERLFRQAPKPGQAVTDPQHGKGTVTSATPEGGVPGNRVPGTAHVRFPGGVTRSYQVTSQGGIEPALDSSDLQAALPAIATDRAAKALDSLRMEYYISGNGEQVINGALRSGRAPSPEVAAAIAKVDKVTGSMRLTEPASMYRGIAMRPGFTLKPGDTFTDNGFTSLSTSKNWAGAFADLSATGKSKYLSTATAGTMPAHAGGTPAILHFSLPAGQQLGPGDDSVGEYVLPRGSTFKVTGRNPDGSLEVTLA